VDLVHQYEYINVKDKRVKKTVSPPEWEILFYVYMQKSGYLVNYFELY
jgi:hypothetical protein